MSEEIRNPSPPPLTKEENDKLSADHIGETLFSKKWVLGLLVKLFRYNEEEIYESILTNKSKLNGEKAIENDAKRKENFNGIGNDIKELQDIFEDEVCELWDISANSDVAVFLHDNDCKTILLQVLDKTQSPRLLEISFGILGNMSCVENVAINMSKEEDFRNTLLEYLSVTDALSLVELTRLLCVLLSHDEILQLWTQTFISSNSEPQPVGQLIVILQNSLNENIVTNIIEILDILFDKNDELMELHCDDVLDSFNEVYELLLKYDRQESISNLLHILQSFTTTVPCVEKLTKRENLVNTLCLSFSDILAGDNPQIKDQCLQSYYSVMNCLLSSKPKEVLTAIDQNSVLLLFLIDILNEKLSEYNTNEDAELNHIYLMVYLEPFHDICYQLSLHEDNYSNLKNVLKEKSIVIKNVIHLCTVLGTQSNDFVHFSENLNSLNETFNIIDL